MPSSRASAQPGLTGGDLALLTAVLVLALAVLDVIVGGALAALLFGEGWAWPDTADLPRTLLGLLTQPAAPAAAYPPALRGSVPGPGPYWGTVIGLLTLQTLAASFAGAALYSRRARPGLARRREVRQAMSANDGQAPIGRYLGLPIRLRAEDSTLVVAPARAGKTTRLAVGRIVDAAGPVVATSTKADLVTLTAHTSTGAGRSYVFDPDRLLSWPTPCRWDAVAGCHDVREALTRARAMVAARPLRGDRNASFFEGASETVLRALLHAAALEQRSMRDVLAWARDFTDDEPYRILRTHPAAAPGWVEDLRAFARAGAPETIASTAMSLGLVLKSLADEQVLDLVCPAAGDGLDIDAFVAGGTDRLYLLSEGGDGISTAPLVTAFASAIVTAARRHSQTRPAGRLNPPLTLVLDEAANVAPLPDLPTLMADGGGRGITTWTLVQSFSQLRARWGRDGADTIWGASTAKLLLGGATEADDLERISRIIGDRWAPRRSHTNRGGLIPLGEHSTSTSTERERILPVQDLARLPTGTGLLLYRAMPPALLTLPAWWERPDAKRFQATPPAAPSPTVAEDHRD